MTTPTAAPQLPRPVLADLVPEAGSRAQTILADILLVVAGAGLTALTALVEFPVPGSPVPITLQTFGVLTAGAALGPVRGTLSQALYVALGVVGLPFFAGGEEAGLSVVLGTTGGYLVGFVLAAGVTGWLARRGWDRGVGRTALAMVLASLVLYACGVPWLAVVDDLGPGAALREGVVPFLPGAAIKIAAAAGVLPSAWRLVRRVRGTDE